MKQETRCPIPTKVPFKNGRVAAKLTPLVLALLVCCLPASAALSAIINIPAERLSVQSGIDAAAEGDTVLVHPGTYFENINFNGKGISLGSLFLTTGDSSHIPITVLDGNLAGPVVTFEAGEDSSSHIIGFTLTNGNDPNGGGIKCLNASPTINHVIIHANDGDGIYCDGSYTPLKGVALSWHGHGEGIQMLTVPSSPVYQRWTHSRISEFSQREDLSSGDIDGDDDQDLLLGTVWMRSDDGVWTSFILKDDNGEPDRNELVDINQDGRLDAVVGFEAVSNGVNSPGMNNPSIRQLSGLNTSFLTLSLVR